MKRTNLFIAALAISLAACNSGKSNLGYEIVTLEEEKLPPVQQLQLEKIDLPEDYTMGQNSLYIYQDSVLIVSKFQNPFPMKKMVTLVNLNNGEIIGDYFTNGRGPRELLASYTQLSFNHLDIMCPSGKLVPINLDSAIMRGNDYKPDIIRTERDDFPSEWCSVDDTMFLTGNNYYFDGVIDGCESNAKLPEFYWFTKSGRCIPEYNESDYVGVKYKMNDISREYFSINKQKNRVVCFNSYRPYAKVFDMELNLIKRINGPEPDDGKYRIDDYMDGVWWNESYGRNFYYRSPYGDDENIFVLNERTHRFVEKEIDIQRLQESVQENIDYMLKTVDANTELFRFDWDGNLIARYSLGGKHLYGGITYSKSSNTLYFCILDNDGESYMYKAKL